MFLGSDVKDGQEGEGKAWDRKLLGVLSQRSYCPGFEVSQAWL